MNAMGTNYAKKPLIKLRRIQPLNIALLDQKPNKVKCATLLAFLQST